MKEILFRCLDTLHAGSSKDEYNPNGKLICNTHSMCAHMYSKNVKLTRLRDLDIPENIESILNFDIGKEKHSHIKDVIVTDMTGMLLIRKNDKDYSLHPLWMNDKYDTSRYITDEDINLYYFLREPDEGIGEPKTLLSMDESYRQRFTSIFTHSPMLLDKGFDNVHFYPWGTSLLDDASQFQIYNKTKLVSLHYSNKTWWTGHAFRTKIADKLTELKLKDVELYGPFNYSQYFDKIDTVKDYFFSIEIENVFQNYFFSDKIVDCCLTGTIPIYKGCPNIGDYFNTDGFLMFNSEDELVDILKSLTPELYHSKMNAIQENFNKALEYVHPEDWIYNNYLKK